MLSDIGDDHSFALRYPMELADDGLWLDLILRAGVSERFLNSPSAQSGPPDCSTLFTFLDRLRATRLDFRVKGGEGIARIRGQ
jgi:hypothetical protein